MDMLEYIIPGTIFLFFAGIALWGLLTLWKIWRTVKSYKASRADETLRAMELTSLKAKGCKILAFLSWPLVLFLCSLLELGGGVAVGLATLVFSLIFLWSVRILRGYNESFKENIVKAELAKVFKNLTYTPGSRFDNETIRDLDFFTHLDGVWGNDLIVADYNDIHFDQCDLRVQEKYEVSSEDEKGNTTTTTHWREIFKGRAMKFDFAERFRGPVQVVRHGFGGAKVTSSNNWHKVETELAEFNTLFTVYAQDPLDAMAVLTPQVVERIFYLSKALNVASAFYFNEKSMYIFMEIGHDSFDISSSRTLLEEQESVRRDVALITGVLDLMYFKAQENTDPSGLQARRSKEVTAEQLAAIATAAGSSKAEALLQNTARTSSRAASTARAFVPYVFIAIFGVSAVHTMVVLPDTIIAGTTADSMEVPTLGYLAVGGLFIVLSALSRNITGYAIAALLLIFHMLFLSANLG